MEAASSGRLGVGRDKMVYMAVKNPPKEEEDDDDDSDDDDDDDISVYPYQLLIKLNVASLVENLICNVCAGSTIDQVKNGVATPFLQIREGLGTNRALKAKAKKKKKGDTRQCQTGMISIILFMGH